MSQENVEIAKRFAEAYAGGQAIERAFSVFAGDVVLHPFPEWVEASLYRGHDGVRMLSAVWTDNFDEFAIGVDDIRDLGDRVLLLGKTKGRIKGSGVPIQDPVGAVFSDFRDGRIGEAYFFSSWRQALEAATTRE